MYRGLEEQASFVAWRRRKDFVALCFFLFFGFGCVSPPSEQEGVCHAGASFWKERSTTGRHTNFQHFLLCEQRCSNLTGT
jgi:hypothetical protein